MLEGAGCDVVLVETVGVGQAEVEVASLADTTLVLLAPGMGDAIQAVKAGILEIADVFVVNKADRDGADNTYRDIQGMIGLGERGPGDWRPQVRARRWPARPRASPTSSPPIDKHRAWLVEHGELRHRRERRAAAEVEAITLGVLRARMASFRDGTTLRELATAVAAGELSPYAAADRLLESSRSKTEATFGETSRVTFPGGEPVSRSDRDAARHPITLRPVDPSSSCCRRSRSRPPCSCRCIRGLPRSRC